MKARETAPAADGYELAVTRYPAQGPAWATMLIAPAMGVRAGVLRARRALLRAQRRARAHLRLPRHGRLAPREPAHVRRGRAGLGRRATSTRCSPRRSAPTTRLPLLVLGHSLGGQILGIAPSNASVRAALHVTAGSGYYGFNERMRLRVRFLWFVAIPLATRIAGYFPGRALGMIGDLPRGVALQWRRWCLHPEYLLAEGDAARAAFERVRCPILSWSFDDDAMLPRRAIESLNGFYRNARLEHRHRAPAEVGAQRIGHFGFFSERHGPALWAESLAWLRSAVGRVTS